MAKKEEQKKGKKRKVEEVEEVERVSPESEEIVEPEESPSESESESEKLQDKVPYPSYFFDAKIQGAEAQPRQDRFREYYMKMVTAEFGDDLDALRKVKAGLGWDWR
jgi:hypothetical protein